MQIDSSSLYRDILKRAFLITWHNRFLWILGLFTTFLGLGSIYEMVFRQSFHYDVLFGKFASKFTTVSLSGILIANNLDKISVANLILFILAVIAVTALAGFLVWLTIVSFGALIKSAQVFGNNKKITFAKSLRESRKKFWPILTINLVGKAMIFLFLSLTGALLSLVLTDTSVGNALIYFFASIIFVAISLLFSFLIVYASCFVAIKSKKMADSIHSTWALFKENWVVSVEAAVILFFINLCVKLALIIIIVLLSVPLMILLLVFYAASVSVAPTILIVFWIILSICILILAGSFFSAFQTVAWTLLFVKIIKGGVLSKLHRIFG
jgi:hypothetical protein